MRHLRIMLLFSPILLFSQISEFFISSGEVSSSSNHIATGNIDLDPAPELVYLRGTEYLYVVDGITGEIKWEGGAEYSYFSVSENPIYDIGDGTYALTFRASVNGVYRVCIYQNGNVVTSSGVVSSSSNHVATGNVDLDPAPELVYLRGTEYLYVVDGITGEIEWENGTEYNSISVGDNPIYTIGEGVNLLTFRANTSGGYRVVSIGETASQHTSTAPHQPIASSIGQNFPNPFNPITNINYSLSHDSEVVLKIFDAGGKEVKTIVNSDQLAGRYDITWDGFDTSGKQVSTGIYLARLSTGTYSETIKMIFIK